MGLFKAASSAKSGVAPSYTGLQIQTAVNALPIPIVWGMAKIAPNLVWYNNFQTIPISSGGGGGGGGKGLFNSSAGTGSTTSYDYTASVILALCEGPIVGINQIWRGQSDYTLSGLGLSLFVGTTPQTTWSYLSTAYPAQALPYQGTAYVCAANYDLSSSATLDNHNFEVQGPFYGSGANGIDADPALVIKDFLTNAQYGIGFPIASINLATLFGAGGDASLQTYCAALGICISPALTSVEKASSILDRWMKICNIGPVWSNGLLNFIPYGDNAIAAGTINTTGVSAVVPPAGSFITPTPTIYVSTPAQFIADLGVTYQISGGALTYIGASAPTVAGTYGISPAGTYLFATGDENVGVTIRYRYSTGASFVPDTTPIYNLGDNDYVRKSNADPVEVERADPYEAYNLWRIEVSQRANAYNLVPIESRVQSAIEQFGERIAPTVTAHEICDANVGAISAQLMVQRAVSILNTFKFSLSWEYCLLDPMDLVTLTDTLLGLSGAPIRITDIAEGKDGLLEITAEEYPQGAASAVLYPTQTINNNPLNRNATAPGVSAPIIFEPTDELAGGLQIWAAVCGSGPNWGGCDVWASSSATGSYAKIGTITGPARMGVTTADLPVVSVNPTGPTIDNTNTLAVDLTISGGTLNSGTDADAVALNTACYVGGEIVGYSNATLTATNKYNLTYLARGGDGTEANIVDHPAGTQFVRLDGAIFKYPYTQDRIGQTLYFKFASFNAFGGGEQSLADCAAYPYMVTGSALASPLPNVQNLRSSLFNVNAGFAQIIWDYVEDFRNPIFEVRLGTSPSAGYTVDRPTQSPWTAPGPGTYWVSAYSQPANGLAVYSENWQSITITTGVVAQNTILSRDEAAANFPGTLSGSLAYDSVGNDVYTTAPAGGTYYASSGGTITSAYLANVSISLAYQAIGSPTTTSFLSVADFLGETDFLGSTSTSLVNVVPMIRIATTLSGGVPVYGSWQKFAPGTYECLAAELAIALSSVTSLASGILQAMKITATVPPRVDTYTVTTGTGATTAVTFQYGGSNASFNGGGGTGSIPVVQATITSGGAAGDNVFVSNVTKTGCDVDVYNGGVRVARTVHLTVTGF